MLDIKPAHKPIKAYYDTLAEYQKHRITKETAVRNAFQELLTFYGKKLKWFFAEEHPVTLKNGNRGSVDGALLDQYSIVMGYWEAKDSNDDLKKEVKFKLEEKGYPRQNILFQEPLKAVLYQDGRHVADYDLTDPEQLVRSLQDFFGYHAEEETNWQETVEQFKQRIPESAQKLIEMIEVEKKANRPFQTAFQSFAELCRSSINPNLSDAAIEEMLVQHFLTSRIFATVFNDPEFVRRNVIAREIERVIDALTSRSFTRNDFFQPLDIFYKALEKRAEKITSWSEKQSFLNTVYEKFFQGFAVKVADTHGIVYTPQPIVDFMVKSVQHILKTEFERSLADEGVHILDPFVGTGNFMLRVIREIAEEQRSRLPKKYRDELHCNEVMLLPYYIAAMNIEHAYYELAGEYRAFDGICLVDTFELAEPAQASLFTTENTERVERQKKSPIFVIMGNPPYNSNQVNENDNNKNRKYPVLDQRVSETYAKDSSAQLVNKLSDPYVKAIRWASDRVGEDGIVAYVSNNSYIEKNSFDGMRKHLAKDFTSVWSINLQGDVRKDSMREGVPIGEAHTVFGLGAMVGIAVTLFVRNSKASAFQLHYNTVDWKALRIEKFKLLQSAEHIAGVEWQTLIPDHRHTWLTEGLENDFDSFLRIGEKKSHKSVFATYSLGINTARDAYLYAPDLRTLAAQANKFVRDYNAEVSRYLAAGDVRDRDSFFDYSELKWSRNLKRRAVQGKSIAFDDAKIVNALYRPFNTQRVYLDEVLIDELGDNLSYYPRGTENLAICISDKGHRTPFSVLATNQIPDLHLLSAADAFQTFPFCTYNEDGSHRRENITDWALTEFQTKLSDKKITKWDIFYYTYALLHHSEYRTKYAANLRRELPRIPVSKDFSKYAEAGKKLAELHVKYEDAREYPLQEVWTKPGLNYAVTKMKLSKDKSELIFNEHLTLKGIPPEVYEYRLGNRSALEWIVDQYQVTTDKRSGITNNPNRPEDPEYIFRLVKKIVTVSVETVKVVKGIEVLSL